MVDSIVLIFSLMIFFLVTVVVGRSIITKQSIIGRPPVPVFYFVLAKMLVFVNLVFLLLRGLKINAAKVFDPPWYLDWIALVFLCGGTVLLILSTIQLNKDLIFGLSESNEHHLHTRGIYSISRHPFYLGFIFILFSSCLLTPNFLNIGAFLGTWFIHHFIMIKEERFLIGQYGQEYRQYMGKVNRYITLFKLKS